jgi:F0F1-type ATP synthase membrane subunit b/b'
LQDANTKANDYKVQLEKAQQEVQTLKEKANRVLNDNQ